MRKRMIDPEFWLDEDLANLSAHARLLYIGLWGLCDDHFATFPNRPSWIKAQIFPYEDVDTRRALDELSTSTHIILFADEKGDQYYWIKNFFKHQKVDRPSVSKYPQFDETRRVLDESSTSTRPEVKLSKVKLSEVKLSKENTAPSTTSPIAVDGKWQRPPLEKQTVIQRIVYHLEDTLHTAIVNWGKQGQAINMMLKAGYTEENIKRTITYMATVDEYFKDKGFDLTTVSNQIARIKAQAEKGAYVPAKN